MTKGIFNLVNKVLNEKLDQGVEKYAKLNGLNLVETEGEGGVTRASVKEQVNAAQEYTYAALTGRDFEGNPMSVHLPAKEALVSSDVSIIFPRVISNILQEPLEPDLFLTNQVAEPLDFGVDGPLYIEFAQIGAIQAHEMAENQEYQQEQVPWAQSQIALRMKKIGVMTSISDEVIARSMWPLVTMYLRYMANAINRKVESVLNQGLVNRSQVVFDNTGVTGSSYYTTGVGATNTFNGSFSYADLVKMCSVLLNNRYTATHFLTHPLAWPIFAQDPIMRAQFYHMGQLGAGIWNRPPQYDQGAMIPFGIAYVPYYAVDYSEEYTFSVGQASGLGSSLISDAYLIDKNNALYLATRGGIEMDEMDDWYKDARQMKARKYCAASVKDLGRGMIRAKSIRIVENKQSIFRVETVQI